MGAWELFEVAIGHALWLVLLLLPLKMWAAWEAARREQVGWFVCFFLINLLGIPEIAYLAWFRKGKRYGW